MGGGPRLAPAVIAEGAVILPASVAYPLWRILRRELDRHRADGGQIRPDIAAALDTLRAAAHHHAMTANGQAGRTSADTAPPSPPELITTQQLADRLGCTERHARRLAAAAGIQAAARGCWHRDDVLHLARTRQEAV